MAITKPDYRRVDTGRFGRTHFINKPCHVCGQLMTKQDNRVIWDIEVNEFRGDDKVYACHERCEPQLAEAIEKGGA